jgi:hypothetical protein
MGGITDHGSAPAVDIGSVADRSPDETLDLTLHVCPACSSALVQPVAWEQDGNRPAWLVSRRCPECGWAGESVHNEVEIDAFDEQLDLGSQELADQLRSMEHANMSGSAGTFISALQRDLIGADDFAR